MNEQAGPACVLSVLIVGAFAVLLHDKDRGASPPKPSLPSIARDDPKPREPVAAGPTTPPTPRLETTLIGRAPRNPDPTSQAAPTPAAERPEGHPTPGPAIRAINHSPSIGPRREVPKLPTRAPRPRGDFTVVEPGETLADVAERVYGSDQATLSLWKANRDQLATIESPLQTGALLRTP